MSASVDCILLSKSRCFTAVRETVYSDDLGTSIDRKDQVHLTLFLTEATQFVQFILLSHSS